jgi:hypothetical protein
MQIPKKIPHRPGGQWLGLQVAPATLRLDSGSFGFDSQTRGTRNQGKQAHPVKVPGSSRVPVRDEQTHPHRPRLVVSHSTCPPLSCPPPREQLCNRSCSNKTHTPVSASRSTKDGNPLVDGRLTVRRMWRVDWTC